MTTKAKFILLSATSLFIGILLLPGVTRATIVDCQPVPGSYTVFLSEPTYSKGVFGNKDQMGAFLQRLQFELDQGRDGKWLHSPVTDVRFIVCENRSPSLDGKDFVPSLVETLHTGRVLLEIWGQLDTKDAANSSPGLWAQINYLLVPIQFAANEKETAPPALQRLVYVDNQATDFVQLIARPLDIDAFVAAAFGFKLLREDNYELALRNLCRASALLGQIMERKLGARQSKDLNALHTFVLSSASHAISEARSNPAYNNVGLLRLQDPKMPCAQEK